MPNESRWQGCNLFNCKEYIDARFAAQDRATELSRETMDARLETMNQFREDLRNQAMHFTTRTEVSQLFDGVVEDIRYLRESKATLEGKASQLSVNIAFLLSLAGLVIAVVAILTR